VAKKILFSIKNKQNKINMKVDESLYNIFQTLTPLQQKAVQDLMASIITTKPSIYYVFINR
jgi:hypothetical protein